MDYTKNYHLPQWKKEDRIMMGDFNAMCASIEDGLGLANRTASAAATPVSLRSGLFRGTYNHLALLMEMKQRPWQLGALYRDFDKGAGNLPAGMAQRPECAWTTNGGDKLCVDSVRASLRKVSDISLEKNCSKLELTFTASGNGWLTGVRMYGRIVNAEAHSEGDCTVRLTDMGTGTALEQRSSFHFAASISQMPRQVLMDFLLQAGQRYRLEVTLDDLNAKPEFKFDPEDDDCLLLTGCRTPTVSIPYTLALEESALGGLALVRYRFQGAAGTPTLNWDGVTLSPHKIRTVTVGGETFQEAEFRRTTDLSAGNSSLNFLLACPSGSNLSLFALSAAVI